MNYSFSRVPQADIRRSVFDRSHTYKTTFDAGYLIPFYVDEALPGDTFTLNASLFARVSSSAMLKAPMDNMYLETFFVMAPMRLVWDNAVKFFGEQTDPDDTIDYTVPQIVAPAFGAGGIGVGTLSDYMGLPSGTLHASNTGIKFNSLWHRLYNRAWNELFRDQNLQDSVPVDMDDGPDTYSDYVLLRRGKRHDYFTSQLPWPVKGDVQATMPLGSTAPIIGIGSDARAIEDADGLNVYETDMAAVETTYLKASSAATGDFWFNQNTAGNPLIYANLEEAAGPAINAIREAVTLQQFLERDARGGTRYPELVKSHFNVSMPYAQWRVEFLGGGSTPISVHPTPQTGATTGAAYQGNVASFGTVSASGGHGFTKSFVEHSLILGLVAVRADLSYAKGIDRMWSRRTRYDFYWPTFANLGEQATLNKEIYCQGEGVAADELVFGYNEAWAEYRYKNSKVTGLMSPYAASNLSVYNLCEQFSALPELNGAFIEDEPPIDRIIAVTSEPHFIFDAYINLRCVRPMPMYSVPGLTRL